MDIWFFYDWQTEEYVYLDWTENTPGTLNPTPFIPAAGRGPSDEMVLPGWDITVIYLSFYSALCRNIIIFIWSFK